MCPISKQSSGHSKNYHPHQYVGIGEVVVLPMVSAETNRGLPCGELELLVHHSVVEEHPEFEPFAILTAYSLYR